MTLDEYLAKIEAQWIEEIEAKENEEPPIMTNTTQKFLVQGCHTQHDRYDVLAYMADSKAEAFAKCKALHPKFDVYSVSEAAPDQY